MIYKLTVFLAVLCLSAWLVSPKSLNQKNLKASSRVKRSCHYRIGDFCISDSDCPMECGYNVVWCYSYECSYDGGSMPYRKKRAILTKRDKNAVKQQKVQIEIISQ